MSGEMMNFPDTAEEFMEQYKIVDSEEVYTNGAELVPIFRMKQWFEQHPEPHWIPVTEDTPKEAGTYMCTCYDAGRRIVTLVKWQPRTKTWNLTGARAYWKVIAWCKRPEPYKGVTE